MPISNPESKPNNRELMLEILQQLGCIKTEISRLSTDISIIKEKYLQSEEAKKGWIFS